MDWTGLPKYVSMSGQMIIDYLDSQRLSQHRWYHRVSYALKQRSAAVAWRFSMANESIHISIAADNEENTMNMLPVGRGHHCCKSQGLDELLAKFYTDLVALGLWKPLSGYVKFVSFQLSTMKESMSKMEVSRFKVRNHIIYSYSNITVCGRPETFSSGARLF
jgi:hypothetical protein